MGTPDEDSPSLALRSWVTRVGGVLLSAALALGVFAAPWGLAIWASLQDAAYVVEVMFRPPPPEEPVFLQAELLEEEEPAPPLAEEVDELADDVDAPPEDGDADEIVESSASESAPGADGASAREGDAGEPVSVEARLKEARRARLKRIRARRREKCSEPHPHVRQGRDGIVEVDRSYVESVTKNLKTFMQLGYSHPHREDGVKGWYISGFGCTSPVHKAGFRRRDVVLTVNGRKTRTWPQVFLVYQSLKNQDAFEVALLRKGEPQTLRFRVVPD